MRAGSGARWHIKKAARTGVAISARMSGWLALRSALARQSAVRVLTYHRFADTPRDPFSVRREHFDAQMSWLASSCRVISLDDLERFMAGVIQLPDRAVLVTIDDGCPSLFTEALPILRRHAIPAVVFVPAGELADERTARVTDADEAHDRISWHELVQVAEAGCTIGSHAWTHRSLGRMSVSEAHEQASRSRALLKERTGQRIGAFAYPYGTRADFNATTAAILRETGYTCAFTSQHGAVRAGADPFYIPRIKVEGGEGSWMFRLLVSGGLDGWQWIDRVLWRFQETGV